MVDNDDVDSPPLRDLHDDIDRIVRRCYGMHITQPRNESVYEAGEENYDGPGQSFEAPQMNAGELGNYVTQSNASGAAANKDPVLHYQLKSGLLSTLPAQRYRKVSHAGVTFTMMVVGESGLGKTTFVRQLFGDRIEDLYSEEDVRDGYCRQVLDTSLYVKTTKVELHRFTCVENGVPGRFTIVDTPGFGDFTNSENAWIPLVDYIDSQHMMHMLQEEQPYRGGLTDTRVHACVYFLPAFARHLRPLDIEAMKALSTRVNLIPVIAKADSCTVDELARVKQLVREDLEANHIEIYQPPLEYGEIFHNSLAPYGIISSLEFVLNSEGDRVRGRNLGWGVCEVENPEHCDFCALRDVLIRKDLLDLIDTTHEIHYGRQRAELMQYRLSCAALRVGYPASQQLNMSTPMAKSDSNSENFSDINETVEDMRHRSLNNDCHSNLELLAKISPYRYEWFKSERLDTNVIFINFIRELKNRMMITVEKQEAVFKDWIATLNESRREKEAEIANERAKIAKLENEVRELRSRVPRHFKLRRE